MDSITIWGTFWIASFTCGWHGFETQTGLYGPTGLTENRSLKRFFKLQNPFNTKKPSGPCEPRSNRPGLKTVDSSHSSSQSLKKKKIYLQAYKSRSPLLQLQTCCQTLRLEITSQFLLILLLYIALSCSFTVSVFFIFSSLLLFLHFCLLYLPLFSCYFLFLPSHLLNLTVNHSLYSWALILIWWTKQCFPFSPFQASSFNLLERLDWVESG